jgi:CRISPR-associated protein Cas6
MPVIDLSFKLVGSAIPLDHGYALYSALCGIVPEAHANPRLGVHPIRGRRDAPGLLTLLNDSRLRLRVPSDEIAPYLAVAGSMLDLGGHRVRVGAPAVESLTPSARLASRMVTIRNAMGPERFLDSVRREMEALCIVGLPTLVPVPVTDASHASAGEPTRRVVRVCGKKVVGYALRVAGLTAEGSIRLQENGLGGRRRFGCGVFVSWARTKQ